MIPIEDNRNKEHQHSIQEIKVDLIALQLPVAALDVLGNTEDRSHHDQGADGVQDPDVGQPWDLEALAARCGLRDDTAVEKSHDDDEEAENDDLNEETSDEDALGCVSC